jgi:hypothetical protein
MKTTIEIPETLYKKAKFLAIERGQTLKQIVLTSLERELDAPPATHQAAKPSWANRKLLPGFAAAQNAGVFDPKPGDRDITDLISDDRDGR